MATKSKAVYLGNTDGEYYGFTVGNEYVITHYDGYIDISKDDGRCFIVKNGVLQKFGICDVDEGLVSKTDCAAMPLSSGKKPELRYFINGYEIDMIEFANVRHKVLELNEGGVKCDTIKFEVKFE